MVYNVLDQLKLHGNAAWNRKLFTLIDFEKKETTININCET